MGNGGSGAGLRRFREAYEAGEDIDVAALVREHPGEALAIANAIREAAALNMARARERMWRARTEALAAAGEDVTLGTLLRDFRRSANLTTTDLSERVQERGGSLLYRAIELIEENRADIGNVPEAVWPALAEVLGIDRSLLFASIGDTAAKNLPGPGFTRMERGATAADRERALGETAGNDGRSLDDYLDRVRDALGLPRVTR